MPYKTPLGPTYDCGDFQRNFEEAVEQMDLNGLITRKELSKTKGKLRGFGLANNVENAAGAGSEFVDISVEQDGNVNVFAGTTEHGQGHPTMYRQVVSELLNIDDDKITVHEGDTDQIAQGNGTG